MSDITVKPTASSDDCASELSEQPVAQEEGQVSSPKSETTQKPDAKVPKTGSQSEDTDFLSLHHEKLRAAIRAGMKQYCHK